jgi:hypothetical protein
MVWEVETLVLQEDVGNIFLRKVVGNIVPFFVMLSVHQVLLLTVGITV